jgi:hypothetical protein
VASTFVAATCFTAQAQGTLLGQHFGANDPTTEGFAVASTYGTPQLGPVTNDFGVNSWSMRISASGINYTRPLPTYLWALDWTLSVTLRIVADSIASLSFSTSVDTGQNYFLTQFGSDPNGNPSVRVTGSSLSPLMILPDASSGYHNYQLRYSAAAGSASLWVDGVNVLGNIMGGAGFSPTLRFGGGYQNPADIQANWNLVSLEIVPEPSSLAVLILGGGLVATHLFRKRHPQP